MPDSIVVKTYQDFDFIQIETQVPEDDIVITYVDQDYIVSLDVDLIPIVVEDNSSDPIVIDVHPVIQHNTYNTGGSTPADVAFTYTAEGKIQTSTKLGVVSTYSYYPSGLLQSIVNPTLTKSFTYNGEGLLEAITIT